MTLASTLAERGKRQLHVAETEKYAHVTYFFNGGEEDEYPGEERRLVDSPRDVPTYDKKPGDERAEAAGAFNEALARRRLHGFGIINFANPDMVGHTGVIEAAVKAVETVDECLGQVVEAVHDSGGVCVITADHGNADQMLEPDGSPEHGPLDEPRAADRDRRRGRAARGRHARRRGTDDPGPAGRGAAARDDRGRDP